MERESDVRESGIFRTPRVHTQREKIRYTLTFWSVCVKYNGVGRCVWNKDRVWIEKSGDIEFTDRRQNKRAKEGKHDANHYKTSHTSTNPIISELVIQHVPSLSLK